MLLSSVVGTRWARIVLPTSVLMLLVVLVYTLWTRGGESASKRREKLAGVIVFWRETPWPSLWSVQPDGSGLRRIYDTRQNAKRPRLSPDGEWIAFDGAAPGKEPLSDFDVQVVRVDGSDRRTLAGTPEYEVDAQWSPNGTTLCYSSYRHTGETDEWLASRISTVTVEGGDRKMLGLGSGARWSPDGKQLAFNAPTEESDGDLFVMNADGSERRRLMATPELEQVADWSPDGRTILFTQFNGSGADVMVMDVDGGNVRTLTELPGFDSAAAWSPDGGTILFTTGRNAAGQFFLMDPDGSDVRAIAGGRVRGFEPSWE